MTRNKQVRVIFALIMVAVMMLPAAVAAASTGPSVPAPKPVVGPRLKPPVIPHTDVLKPATTYNYVAGGFAPASAYEANTADAGRTQEKPGRGIRQTKTGLGEGTTLYAQASVCNNFNIYDDWAAKQKVSDIWTDWYRGWAPFAVDNGYYQAKNVGFSIEKVVGPGNAYGDEKAAKDKQQASLKIFSGQPYAAGVGSPIIPVPAGYEGGSVMVTVSYLIWDHDQGGKQGGSDGMDYDWASLGVKAGAAAEHATYVNGYVRGEWAQLTNEIALGDAKDVMVLLQAHSPATLNSNIYFDNVKIGFKHGDKMVYLTDCTLAGSIK